MTLKELSMNAAGSLQACLRDEDPQVRKAAEECLEKIKRGE
jgi:vesicle coat complex subunit